LLQRKLLKVGNSLAVSLPPSWIKAQEKRLGQPLDGLVLRLSDGEAIILPISNKIRKEEK